MKKLFNLFVAIFVFLTLVGGASANQQNYSTKNLKQFSEGNYAAGWFLYTSCRARDNRCLTECHDSLYSCRTRYACFIEGGYTYYHNIPVGTWCKLWAYNK